MTLNAETVLIFVAFLAFLVAAVPLPKDWKGAWDFVALGFAALTLTLLVGG